MTISKKINNISKEDFWDSKKPYITKIYFPHYKQFRQFSEINFDFPITVLVGKNGSGKSSILHALYGCPHNYSIGDYWFSTKVDPIEDDENNRQCFVYTYREGNEYNQVSYQRGSRPGTKTKKKNLDYWETAGYVEKYKMDSQLFKNNRRFPPMKCKLVYVDFRQELSAYDKYFYFGDPKRSKSNKKQDYIRNQSLKLDNIFNGTNQITKVNGIAQNEELENLTNQELHFISEILGIKYTGGKIVKHHFFEKWGESVLLNKAGLFYSEAHAGSGEYAVAALVHKLLKIGKDEPCLVLLDEPETSLYPGAQKRLLEFLLYVVEKNKWQIVISTHSEKFISELPESAIKAIHYNESTGESIIVENCRPESVFEELDISHDKTCVYVEDVASCILLSMISAEEKFDNQIIFRNLECGAETLKKTHIFSSSQQEDFSKFYILDGDQRVNDEDTNVQNMILSDYEDYKKIDELAKKVSSNASFPSSRGRNVKKNMSDDIDRFRYDSQLKYLNYFNKNVMFLPLDTPEDIIWNEEHVVQVAETNDIELKTNGKKKDVYYNLAKGLYGKNPSKNQYENLYRIHVNYWIKHFKGSKEYMALKQLLEGIVKNKE